MIKIKDRIKRLRRGADYENYYTALDIGTEYIKALVVRREGRNGVVLGASRERKRLAAMQEGWPPASQAITNPSDGPRCAPEAICDTIPARAGTGTAGDQAKGSGTSV